MNTLFKDKKFKFLLGAVILVAVFEILSLSNVHLNKYFAIPFFALICIVVGHEVLKKGLLNIVKLNFRSINTLMTIAVIGAFYLGEYPEAAIVIVLYTLGEYLEKIGVQKSKSAIQSLIDNAPKTAVLKKGNKELPIEEIKIDDIIIIKPGSMIPMDGEVVEGTSSVDEASITGEPIPIDKHFGDKVFAGTLNKQGYLEIKVIKTAKDSTLSKIVELTFNATKTKANTQKFIEKFASYYVPSVIIATLLIVVVPVAFTDANFDVWLLKGLTLLVISCPCALVISTPVSIYSAVGNASQKGILVKGGKYLEEMGLVKAIAFDKTRTLTYGTPEVSDIVPFSNYSKADILSCASGYEVFSEHPIAQSIVNKAKEEKIPVHEVKDFMSVPGKGVKGNCTVCYDKHHCIGSLEFVTEEHEVRDEIVSQVETFQKQGKTTIVLSSDKDVKGVIALSDTVKPESKELIQQMKNLGVKTIMLTGDNKTPAKYVAEELGIDEVKAGLLPEEKLDEITLLKRKYGTIAMTGDGVNDAPALATADIGIAMGGNGADVAIETADVCLMNDYLLLIPFLIKLSRKTLQTIKINTGFAIGVKFLFILLAVFGLSNLVLAIFADVGVTILVIANSLRLSSFKS
ncbi:MAG: cadmium-translocating P-type ATPase [Ignavibacteria bacterium]|jgi:Cd2+/Zn2+-exporting ATPase|nr:cadmium-translocating P-type ATPase [Ignavibacteria bacterium]